MLAFFKCCAVSAAGIEADSRRKQKTLQNKLKKSEQRKLLF